MAPNTMRDRLEFNATEIGYFEEYEMVSCGASNAESTDEYHYINFQRPSVIGSPDDEGIYFEIDTQSQSGYNLIESITIKSTSIRIILNDSAKNIPHRDISVLFDAPASDNLRPIQEGLTKVFKGYECLYK